VTATDDLLPHVLARRAVESPDHCYVEEVGGSSATYAEFDVMARTWGDAFRRLGVQPGELVGSMQPASLDELATWVGLSWTGAVEVPLNLDYKGRMLFHAVSLCGLRVMVVRQRFVPVLAEVLDDLPSLQLVVLPDASSAAVNGTAGRLRVIGRDEFLDGATPASDLPGPEPWDPATVIFTSGTTGPSKAVSMPWGQLHVWASRQCPIEDLDEGDVWYGPWPTFHVTGKYPPLMMALVGGKLVLREQLSPSAFVEEIRAYGVTVAILALALIPLLDSAPPDPSDGDLPLKHIIMVPVIDSYEAFQKRWGVRISTSYAMTEIGPVFTRFPGEIEPTSCASVGRPRPGYPGYEVRLVGEHDVEVGPKEVGELIVRTDAPWTLNSGYVGMPDRTAEAWRNGWFHTGDAFRRDAEGNFYFVDRMKDCIRRRGENISSFEIEASVNEHPSILESAAVPVLSATDGEDVRVIAVRQPGSDVTAEALYSFLVDRLPRFMLPRYIEFVPALPKTQTQKVRKIELRDTPMGADTWDRTVGTQS